MPNTLTAKFWGVRGSYPKPGAETVKFGGNTACVEVRAGEKVLILDAGTGIIPLGQSLAKRFAANKGPHELILLFSHMHHDHTQGFPFFAPAYLPNVKLNIFGPGVSPDSLKRVLEHNQSPTSFPVELHDMAATKTIRSLRERETILWDQDGVRTMKAAPDHDDGALVIRIHRSYAHPGGVYVYRISWRGQSVVYATDIEGYVGTDRRLTKFARDADLLIHDAQYKEEHYRGNLKGFPSTQGFGHSTAEMACGTVKAARIGRLVLFHHEPAYDDDTLAAIELSAQKRFGNTLAAYEGLEIPLPGSKASQLWRGERKKSKRVQYVKNGRHKER